MREGVAEGSKEGRGNWPDICLPPLACFSVLTPSLSDLSPPATWPHLPPFALPPHPANRAKIASSKFPPVEPKHENRKGADCEKERL